MYKRLKFYIENDLYYVQATATVSFYKVDDSFDHEFGIKRQFIWEPTDVTIESVIDPETGLELPVLLPKDLESMIIDKAIQICSDPLR